MPKICYQDISFGTDKLAAVRYLDDIVNDPDYAGLKLTLRQIYYVMVSNDLFPDTRKYVKIPGTDKWRHVPPGDPKGIKNATPNYKWLGDVVNEARLAGLLDWDIVEDRTRELKTIGHWDDPSDIMESAAKSFRTDKWAAQDCRVEVWIEKDALLGVFQSICETQDIDVPYLSCRGYTSQSEMWGAAMRFVRYLDEGKSVHVYHFGDHDPSGIDMTRDIQDRIRMFVYHHVGEDEADRVAITRVALNMDQVEKYKPENNPAKTTDSRSGDYIRKFGDSSWELDALRPNVLAALVRKNVRSVRDEDLWEAQVEKENHGRAVMEVASGHWEDLEKHAAKKWGEEIAKKIKEG